jgi:hypothetical protein
MWFTVVVVCCLILLLVINKNDQLSITRDRLDYLRRNNFRIEFCKKNHSWRIFIEDHEIGNAYIFHCFDTAVEHAYKIIKGSEEGNLEDCLDN